MHEAFHLQLLVDKACNFNGRVRGKIGWAAANDADLYFVPAFCQLCLDLHQERQALSLPVFAHKPENEFALDTWSARWGRGCPVWWKRHVRAGHDMRDFVPIDAIFFYQRRNNP